MGSFSKYQKACEPGTFTDVEGKGSCDTCTVGYYCPGAIPVALTGDTGAISSFRPLICPAGYYCEAGSKSPTMCAIGRFGNKTALKVASECAQCLPGSYCAEPGAVAPTGKCDAGYICKLGSTTPRPDATSTPPSGTAAMGSICPAGGYCEIGSSVASSCQGGSFNPNKGGKNILDCQ